MNAITYRYSGKKLTGTQDAYVRSCFGRDVRIVHLGRWRVAWTSPWTRGYWVGLAVGVFGMLLGRLIVAWSS